MELLLERLWPALQYSLLQFVALFGLMIAGGTLLTLLSRWTNNTFKQFMYPNFGMYAFGWLGVPVHELSHAIFCKIFFHEVRQVKWFDPKAKNGAHGSVTHYYHPWNPYHRLGHFFIGLGPVILGPALLAVLFYYLVPLSQPMFHQDGISLASSISVAAYFLQAIISPTTLTSIGFYIFIYIAICVCSQMELSIEDIKQALLGVIPLTFILFLVNLLALWIETDWNQIALGAAAWIASVGSVILVVSVTVSLLNLLFWLAVMSLIHKICGYESIDPFRH